MNISSFFRKKTSTGTFIPNSKSGFAEFTNTNYTSFNELAELLGYTGESLHCYIPRNWNPESSAIQMILVEAFTRNIVCVKTLKSVSRLTDSMVKAVMKYFDLKEEYSSVVVADVLTRGIENRSLSIGFLARVLNIQEPSQNGVFYVESLGLYLYFNNGVLVDFSPSDGLNQWAKHWNSLNPAFIAKYEALARTYWGDNRSKVIQEVNVQAEALTNVPDTFNNEYADLHRTEHDTVNWFMLLATHYTMPITLPLFLDINHGRYDPISEELGAYQAGKFIYRFDQEGRLVECHRCEPATA